MAPDSTLSASHAIVSRCKDFILRQINQKGRSRLLGVAFFVLGPLRALRCTTAAPAIPAGYAGCRCDPWALASHNLRDRFPFHLSFVSWMLLRGFSNLPVHLRYFDLLQRYYEAMSDPIIQNPWRRYQQIVDDVSSRGG